MNLRMKSRIISLDALFLKAKSLEDEETQAHFAKYLCIRVSGLLENYIKSQIGDYVDKTSAKPIANYVKSKVKSLTNINYEKLIKFLKSFSNDWADNFDNSLSDELKSSLNAIISNRNGISHGNSNNNITFGNMKKHYENMKKVIAILDEIIKK